jgi:hypothetical protein
VDTAAATVAMVDTDGTVVGVIAAVDMVADTTNKETNMSEDTLRIVFAMGGPVAILLAFWAFFWSIRGFHEKIYGPNHNLK